MSTGAEPPFSQEISPKLTGKGQESRDQDLLEVLTLLMRSGKVRSAEDLIRYAEQAHAPEAAERLRRLHAEGIPLDLAFDALSVHLRILAHKRNSALLRECQGRRVGLIVPLPPHIFDLFIPVASVEILLPAESHQMQGFLHEYSDKIIHGSRACRDMARGLEVLVFEAARESDTLYVDPGVSDLVDPRSASPATRFVIHIRPHRNPDDVPFVPTANKVDML